MTERKVVEKFSDCKYLSYEWSEFHVFEHPREPRKFAVDTRSGCSCDIYEYPTLEQLEAFTPLGKREVYAKFSEWWGDDAEHSGSKVDGIESLRHSL